METQSILNDIMKAKERVWLAVPKIEYLLYEDILLKKALGGVDVRVVTIDDGRPTKVIENFIRDKNQAIKNAKGRIIKMMIKWIVLKMGSSTAFAIMARPIPLFGIPNGENFASALINASMYYLAAIFLDAVARRYESKLGKAMTELMELERVVERERDELIRYLIASRPSGVDGLYIVDDNAWINRDGELKEIDIREAEEKFMQMRPWMYAPSPTARMIKRLIQRARV